jgi:TfoX C-terminal domain
LILPSTTADSKLLLLERTRGNDLVISHLPRQTWRAMPRKILQMRNLGPRCAEWLAQIGIHDETDIRSVGAAAAYRELIIRGVVKPHRMLLYALGGALLDIDCNKLPRDIKRSLEEEASID